MQNDLWNDITNSAAVRIAVIGVLAILALFLFVRTADAVQNFGRLATPPTNTITVQGDGRAAAAPDIATVDFTVMHTAKNVADAQQAAVKQANDALAAVKALGVADKDVRTVSYVVSPQYDYGRSCGAGAVCPPSTPTIVGYQVMESIEVKVRDTSKAGDVLGKLGNLGVQNISGPNFTLDDPTKIQAEARAEAIAKAKDQARTLASQLGVRLGNVVNFSESGPAVPYAYGKGGVVAETAAAAPSPTTPTGQNEYASHVYITYEIR